MKNKILGVAVLVCFATISGHASLGQEGHGGNVVVSNGKVSLLDLVENNYIFLNPSKENYFQNLLKKLNLALVKIEWLVTRPSQMTWVLTDEKLEKISDQGIISTTQANSIEQVAIQKDNIVLINRPLFLKMSDVDKAALLVHELLISTALNLGFDVNSDQGTAPIRKVVAILFSENSEAVGEKFYQDIWNELPILKNSRADKNINKLRDPFLQEITGGTVIYSWIINPRVQLDDKLYPLKSSGSDPEKSYRACFALGFSENTLWGVKNEKLLKSDFLTDLTNIISLGTPELSKFPIGTEYYKEIGCSLSPY